MASRFVVGIDLGTTNSAPRLRGHRPRRRTRRSRRSRSRRSSRRARSKNGRCCRRSCTCPGAGEQPAGALKLPWDAKRDYCVGEFARAFGSQVPTRLVASAKSWLCHPGVDRKAPILPHRAPDTGRKVSPRRCQRRAT